MVKSSVGPEIRTNVCIKPNRPKPPEPTPSNSSGQHLNEWYKIINFMNFVHLELVWMGMGHGDNVGGLGRHGNKIQSLLVRENLLGKIF